jgi:translation initiation factor 1
MSKRIDTGGGESLGANPFDSLSSKGLPKADQAGPKGAAPKKSKAAPKKGRVELRREKSGRGGKTVTVLSEFATHLPLGELDNLAFDLKKSCACGGTLKGRSIELQGDVRDRAFAELEKRGFRPVKAGG